MVSIWNEQILVCTYVGSGNSDLKGWPGSGKNIAAGCDCLYSLAVTLIRAFSFDVAVKLPMVW